jgi:hypothetical protein
VLNNLEGAKGVRETRTLYRLGFPGAVVAALIAELRLSFSTLRRHLSIVDSDD